MIVACVLRSGGDYTPRYVRALASQLPGQRIVCLTDFPPEKFGDGITVVPLAHNWPGWWAKLELFRPDLFDDTVLYLDLDTFVVGNIDKLLTFNPGDSLYMIHDVGYRELRAQSGVMCWRPAEWLDELYHGFVVDGKRERLRYTDACEGDGDYISDRCWSRISLLQDTFNGWFCSYKWQAKDAVPAGVRLVCFHGRPRPHAVTEGWAAEHWRKHTGAKLCAV